MLKDILNPFYEEYVKEELEPILPTEPEASFVKIMMLMRERYGFYKSIEFNNVREDMTDEEYATVLRNTAKKMLEWQKKISRL